MTTAMTRIPKPGPMDPDARRIWNLNAAPAAAHGVLTEATATRFEALCFGAAMDARFVARLEEEPAPRERKALRVLRRRMQQLTRSCAWSLGLIPLERVETVPRGPGGADAELQEWIIVTPARGGEQP